MSFHYDTGPYVNMTLNLLPLELTGFFVTRTNARDHGMTSLSFFFLITECLESAPPLSLSPSVVQGILKNLKTLNAQYCQLNVTLFSKHLPGVLAPMGEADLQSQIEADRILQQQLRANGFESGRGLKRSNSDLEPN